MAVDGEVGGWLRAASAAEIEEGTPFCAEVGGVPVLLVRIGETIHAASDICTHQFARLSDGWLEGEIIECPIHAACFNVRTGECLGPIAEEDLQTFPLELRDGEVYVRVKG